MYESQALDSGLPHDRLALDQLSSIPGPRTLISYPMPRFFSGSKSGTCGAAGSDPR